MTLAHQSSIRRTMDFQTVSQVTEKTKTALFHLWNNEYPEKLNFVHISDFDSYLNNLEDTFHLLVMNEFQEIAGWYFDFVRENERWFALILDSGIHRKGIGAEILRMAKEKEPVLNGWVIDHSNDRKKNGEIYTSPLSFYLKNGFEELPEIRLELEKISAVKIVWTR